MRKTKNMKYKIDTKIIVRTDLLDSHVRKLSNEPGEIISKYDYTHECYEVAVNGNIYDVPACYLEVVK
jgi:hypothetical protein